MIDNKFLIETHSHTKEVSGCSGISAEKLVELYIKAGFDGLIITDHYFDGYLDAIKGDWESKAERYLEGVHKAKKFGTEKGLKVYTGMEIGFVGSYNHYLVFGVTEKFIVDNKQLYKVGIEGFRRICDDNGLLLFQAHPFRGGMTRVDTNLLDGIEVFNGHPEQSSHNEMALEHAILHNKKFMSGSDCHHAHHVGRGGIYLKKLPEDEKELSLLVKNDQYELKYTEDFASGYLQYLKTIKER